MTLSVMDHSSAGYSVYLVENGKFICSLAFANSKHHLYSELLCACKVLDAVHQ